MTSPLLEGVKGLLFDVFGTVVDWRRSVEVFLKETASDKIASSPSFNASQVPPDTQARVRSLTDQDWATFAQEWRNSYGKFTRGFVPGETEWKDIDTHHRDSLVELLDKWQLNGLYTPGEIERLSKVWHYLVPWPDSSQGIHKLGTRFKTATLSNGNQSLLRDLDEFGNLGFQRLISAEDFKAYKPNPATYLGACKMLGLEPQQVAMVAAHLGDLAAARSHGLRTVYVERSREEELESDDERYGEARQWVDVWISQSQAGFIELAKELGL
ncbi:putative haloacid dehalogenase protein [Diplogelasinospora grovesii]|uniref:Haloacid dehalogenase protein n=1 Tax=Diplogelasinospora grovesii TaxID=303347 RepID=A0AAN6S9X3_9PEZI|nr:putative haloacid dehalogenase protein [Diplogelasinospora grovesii]